MTRILRPLAAIALILVAAGPVTADPLYDAALGTGPADQGWLYLTWPLPPLGTASAVQTLEPTPSVRLDTLPATSDSAGYLARLAYSAPPVIDIDYRHPGLPDLNRAAGYRVTFDLQVHTESHLSDDRAGCSIIALSDDLLGIELGFWEDSVWAQSGPDFLRAETTAFDTTAAMTRYELEVVGSQYSLLANGAEILAGSLRDYSPAASGSDPLRAVYALESFLFLGDDTGSAAAEFELAFVAVETGIAVPEPTTGALLFSGGGLLLAGGLACARRRRTG